MKKKTVFKPQTRNKTFSNPKVPTKPKESIGNNYTSEFCSNNNLQLDGENVFENLISKIFKYLEDKVATDVYDDLKNILNEELNLKKEGVNLKSPKIQEVLNLITKNSRNGKSDIFDGEVGEDKNFNLQNLDIIKTNLNNKTIDNKMTNYAVQKNLKLSFDLTSINKNSITKPITNIKDINEKPTSIKKSNQTPKGNVIPNSKETSSIPHSILNQNSKNVSSNIPNLNLKGYLNFSNLNFCNQIIDQKKVIENAQHINNIGTQSNPNLNSGIPINNLSNAQQSKSSLFNIVKNGKYSKRNEPSSFNSKNPPIGSKTQSNSISKSNSRETNPRSALNSFSQSKSKSKSKIGGLQLKTETVNLNNLKDVKQTTATKPSQNVFLKLNAKLTKKTGISPDGIRSNNISNIGSQFKNFNITNSKITLKNNYNSNTNTINIANITNSRLKNKTNLSSQSQIESGSIIGNNISIKKVISSQKETINSQTKNNNNTKKVTYKPSENIVSNYKERILNNYLPSSNLLGIVSNPLKKIVEKKNVKQPEAYQSNQSNKIINNSTNEYLKINTQKKLSDLTYNTAKEKEREFYDNLKHKEEKRINFNSDFSIPKYKDQNVIELVGENIDNRIENNNIEIIKEIKMKLDDNLKNMFNFSYDNFHKEQLEKSGFSTKKSVEISNNLISQQDSDENFNTDEAKEKNNEREINNRYDSSQDY